MKYKRLAYLSIIFAVLIFFTQSLLIVRLFRINQDYLGNVLNSVSKEAYASDMNTRLKEVKSVSQPGITKVNSMAGVDTTNAKVFNTDKMSGVDKSNPVAIINVAIESFLSDLNPLVLAKVDSLASISLKKENINAKFYTRIFDKKTGKIIKSSIDVIPSSSGLFPSIISEDISLSFDKSLVLQMVLLHPLRAVFSQMIGMLILSLLLSLFCIYCIYTLQRMFAKQKKLAQSKNDFYNQVSHELKRPISLFSKALDSLKNPVVIQNTDKRDIYLKMSTTELNKMSDKIDMILSMSMEEDGMLDLDITEFELNNLIEEVKDNMMIKAEKPVSINFTRNLENPFVFADKDHLYQCISNLIENSMKYSGENVNIDIIIDKKDKYFTISVIDDGYGISSENINKIFIKFERLKNIKKTPGYGIGLSYVKQIIEKHGGHIEVKSDLGKGSEFMIMLPVKKI